MNTYILAATDTHIITTIGILLTISFHLFLFKKELCRYPKTNTIIATIIFTILAYICYSPIIDLFQEPLSIIKITIIIITSIIIPLIVYAIGCLLLIITLLLMWFILWLITELIL